MNSRRLLISILVTTAAVWLCFAVSGGAISDTIADKAGETVIRLGKGKIQDASLFIHHRLLEVLWLATFLSVGALLHGLVDGVSRRSLRLRQQRWIIHSLLAFVLLNVWVTAAGQMVLFWAIMGAGKNVQNLALFHFKRTLLSESEAPLQAILVGSSQTRAQIDEEILNQRLKGSLRTTELHFPGSHAYDLLLVEKELRASRVQFVVVYLSEGYFYGGSQSPVVPNFLGFSDLPDYFSRGAQRFIAGEPFFHGVLGCALPLFRYREVLAQRLLGSDLVQLEQSRHDASLAVDLDRRAQQVAPGFHLDAESDFQKQAFTDFVEACGRRGRRVVILPGQLNPLLGQRLPSGLRRDMREFLKELAAKQPNVILVSEEALPEQPAADYEDLTHVRQPAQERFSNHVAELLKKIIATTDTHVLADTWAPHDLTQP